MQPNKYMWCFSPLSPFKLTLFQKETKDKDGVTDTDYPEGFYKEPFCTYEGHTGDVLDLSWSKVFFHFYINVSFLGLLF